MELWIRSQDKEILTICRDLWIGGTYGNEIIADTGCSIGIYETKERALEVLDKIQNKINAIANMDDINFINVVYEMPKE